MHRALALLLLILLCSSGRADDALDRLTEKNLAAVRAAITDYAAKRQQLPQAGPFRDYRANLHVHSLLSHDSRMTISEIVVAAKKAGSEILMFTDHPADHYDSFTDGHSGLREGVLLVPGAETKGLLVYPKQSFKGLDGGTTEEFSNLVRGRGGLTFLSHLEERMDLDVPGITGNEIYNTHFDFKSQKRLVSALKNPLWWVRGAELFKRYPQECVGALQNYPASYLARWDELCQRAPHTGVSANDAHQNVGIRIRLIEDSKKAVVEDALGERVVEMDSAVPMAFGLKPFDENGQQLLFKTLLDPYEVSLRHVATHLLLREQTVPEVWDALEQGRAYVSFDWIADARGFDFHAHGDRRYEMGEQVAYRSEMQLNAEAPLPGHWKLIRNGSCVEESDGPRFNTVLTMPGIYRVEVWLKLVDQDQIWILSNPIYVK